MQKGSTSGGDQGVGRGAGGGGGGQGGGASGGGSSGGAASPEPEPQIVTGWQYHTYSNGTAGDSSRYAYIGKDESGTPEFVDWGPKGSR